MQSSRELHDVRSAAGSSDAGVQRGAGDPSPRRRRGALSRVLSDGSLTKRASLTAGASFLDFAARLVVGLVVTPILLSGLGAFTFGVWQVLQRLLGQASAATGRPGEALKWVLAQEQDSDDDERKRRHVGSAAVVWLLFSPLLLTSGAVLTWFAPLWLDVPSGSRDEVRLAAAIVMLTFVLVSIAYLPESVLHGQNLAYKRVGLSTLVVGVGGALTVLALALGTGIVGVATAALLTTCLTGLMYLRIVRACVSWFGIARPRREEVRWFLGLSGWFMLWNLVMQVMRGADVVLLGVAASAELATVYTLTRYIPEAVTLAAATVIFAVMPGLGGLIGRGELRRAVEVRGETMAFTWLLTASAGATMLLWQRSFLGLWVDEEYYTGTGTMLLIVLMIVQFAVIRTDSNIIDLTLRLRSKVVLGLLSAALSVALAWALLVPADLGIAGLVTGFIAGRLVLTVAYPVLIGRMLGIDGAVQVRGVLRPAAATALLLGVCTVVGDAVSTDSWWVLVPVAAVSMTSATLAAFFLGLPVGLRRSVVGRVRRVARLT